MSNDNEEDQKSSNERVKVVEDEKLPSKVSWPTTKVSDHLVFVFDTSRVCGSNVGQTGEKWCAVEKKRVSFFWTKESSNVRIL